MDTTKVLIIGVVIIVLGGIGWFAVAQSGKDDAMMQDEQMMEKTDDAMMQKDDSAMMETGDAMMRKGTYETYAPEKLALATKGNVLLFFHADWCPVCRALEAEILAGAMIPEGVHILKVDYDTATSLRQKYGVTVQHTFVQVDANGTAEQKFMDETTLAGVLARVR